jgi:hypothetical protein
MLSVPFRTAGPRTDGGRPPPELFVRRGASPQLRDVISDDRPAFPSPGCTTITVHPHRSRRPSVWRRLLERLTF